jgi:hypothetical protein
VAAGRDHEEDAVSTPTVVEDDATPIVAPLPPPPARVASQSTEPVERVPGPAAADRPRVPTRRVRRRPSALVGPVLGLAAVVLLEVGLLHGSAHAPSLWHRTPLWCGFATVAALVGLLASLARGARSGTDRAWRISAAGLTGLAVFWVLVVLPMGNTDLGFVLTAALGLLGVSLWVAPGRKA